MSHKLPTHTQQSTRAGSEEQAGELITYLVRALECEAVSAGASRHVLTGVHEVRFERAERALLRTSDEEGQRLLTLRIPDPRMSALHARFYFEDNAWFLEDLGSTNGSAIWGKSQHRVELVDRDLITLGSTLFVFRSVTLSQRLRADQPLAVSSGSALDTLCPAVEAGLRDLTRVAASNLPVLLLGETGTGKEVLAKAVHELSQRSGPCVAVNCGAIPAPLMEAQLFGHTKGAFTGALRDEVGFVRSAQRGTLFLDEIADLPPASQAALLRVLQSGEVTPVGSTKTEVVDVRIVAATHRDLPALSHSGAFRKDLFARLAGYVHQLPPLRERIEDIGLLAGRLLLRHGPSPLPSLSVRAAQALFSYAFPLNIRELEHALQTALALCGAEPIQLAHLPEPLRQTQRPSGAPASSTQSQQITGQTTGQTTPAQPAEAAELSAQDEAIRRVLIAALQETKGNVTETARRMGRARQQIQRWVRRFALDPNQFR